MATQTTTHTSTPGMRTLIGTTAASLALLGGALLWHTHLRSEPAAPAATTAVSSMSNKGVIALGGLAELYREAQQTQAARDAGKVTTLSGLAEQYAQEAAQARRAAALDERISGMAELHREQARTVVGRP